MYCISLYCIDLCIVLLTELSCIGLTAEVTRIKEYVEEANQTKEFREKMKVIKTHLPKPGFSVMLLGSQLMIGW